MRILSLILASGLLAACSVLPQAAPPVAQHDLGGTFERVGAPPLRTLAVSAAPLAGGLAMNYREAARPSMRAAYAFNRWAAPPADLVAAALARLLPLDAQATCRLDLRLDDVLLDVDERGQGAAVLAAGLRLSREGQLLGLRNVDLRVPLAQLGPAAFALGEREATRQLAATISGWLAGEAGAACRAPRS